MKTFMVAVKVVDKVEEGFIFTGLLKGFLLFKGTLISSLSTSDIELFGIFTPNPALHSPGKPPDPIPCQ
jgi:hypothetical protein